MPRSPFVEDQPIAKELAALDRLGGSNPRSIQFLEAAWPKDAPIPWVDAYVQATIRATQPAADQHDGKTVAFLEGLLIGMRLLG